MSDWHFKEKQVITMKKLQLGMTILFVIFNQLLFMNIFVVEDSEAFVPWGLVADDESVIQPFIVSRTTGKDWRIPQDESSLDLDYFWIYLEWRGSQTSRQFIFQLHEKKEREIIVGEQIVKEEYWDIYAEMIVSLYKGSNEWNDPRFALARMDNSILPEFQKSSSTEKVVLLYRDLIIEFYHKTSYAEIEQTKTIMQWNMESIMLVAWVVFLAFVAGGSSKLILDKATYVPDLPHWSIWILMFLLLFISALVFLLISGYNMDEVFRVIVLVPAPLIAVFFALYLAFWLASKFRPARLREFLFLILDLPTLEQVRTGQRSLRDEHELPVDAITMEGYVTKNGDFELIDDPQSYWETLRRIKTGGIKFSLGKLGKRIRVRQKWKTFDDIIFCESFEKKNLDVKMKDGALWSLSSVIILIGIFCWIFPIFFDIAGIASGILGAIFLTFGSFLFIWENIDISPPLVNVKPITNRSAIEIIRDKLSLDMKDEEISELELDLYKEKANLAKKARSQTLKALEEVEEAVLPLKEISEGEIDIEDLPEGLKKIVKTWTEKWSQEKGLGDVKEIVEQETGEKS